MSPLLARTGRERQRYENNVRLVSGCIPYRITKDKEEHNIDLEERIEVLMISSPHRTDLVFPKGGWEDDETVLEAACREALEEAGVKGILRECPIGEWEFRSKSRKELCDMEGGCKGLMFALEVTEELETWPEQEYRDRKWLNTKDAFEFCRYEWMREALDRFLSLMKEEEMAAVATDCSIMSSNCYINSSNEQRPGLYGILPLSWQIALKRLPLT